jgi:hypothetical protein
VNNVWVPLALPVFFLPIPCGQTLNPTLQHSMLLRMNSPNRKLRKHYRGLVNRAVERKLSSASWYLLDPPRQPVLGLPFIHSLPTGALDR